MHLWGKIVLGVVGILLLLFAVGVGVFFFNIVPLLALQEWMVNFHTLLHFSFLTRALSVVGIVLLVAGAVALLRLLVPRGGRFLTYRTEDGEIRVSFDSLEALAREALQGFQEIVSVIPRVEKVGKEACMVLHLVVRTDASIPELSNLVQTKVRERVERQTGIVLKNVRLLVDLKAQETV